MAITVAHGKAGSVTWTSETQAAVTSWSIDFSVDMADASAMDTTNDYRYKVVGHTDWTATVEILIDDSAILMGTSAALGELLASGALVLSDGTRTITGTGIATNIALSVPATDTVRAVYTFQGNSALT